MFVLIDHICLVIQNASGRETSITCRNCAGNVYPSRTFANMKYFYLSRYILKGELNMLLQLCGSPLELDSSQAVPAKLKACAVSVISFSVEEKIISFRP